MKLLGVQAFELCLKELVRVIKAAKAESLAEQRKEARRKVCVCVCVKRVIVSRNGALYPHKMAANLNDKCFVCSDCFTNWPFLHLSPSAWASLSPEIPNNNEVRPINNPTKSLSFKVEGRVSSLSL